MRKLAFGSILFFGIISISYGQTVIIGTQVWCTKNLDVVTFRNGDTILRAGNADEWKKAADNRQPAWCNVYNDADNNELYGKLYNWYAVNDKRGLTPKGYHIPTNAEWKKLADYLGGEDVAAVKLKSSTGWFTTGSGKGTNESGFNALAAGTRSADGKFRYIQYWGCWWSFTENDTNEAWYLSIGYKDENLNLYPQQKGFGYSVRCIKD